MLLTTFFRPSQSGNIENSNIRLLSDIAEIGGGEFFQVIDQ